MKKFIAIVLSLICVIGVFAGCNNQQGTQGTTTVNPGEGKDIVIGIPLDMTIEDYETNSLTLWIEEQTGHNLTFKTYASDPSDYATQLSGQIMAGEALPHMLFQFNNIPWSVYGEDVGGQRYFLNLTDMIMDREKSANWWYMMDTYFTKTEIEAYLARAKNEAGEIIPFPTAQASLVDALPFIASINTAWLEKVGMEAPTNPDELYAVLKAFKEQCCEGRNEFPLIGGGRSVIGGDVCWWIINMFCPGYDYDNYFGLTEDGMRLTTPFTSNEYRQALIFIKKLVDEGLMPKDVVNWTERDVAAMVDKYDQGIIIGHATVTFTNDKSDAVYKYEPLDLYGYTKFTLRKGTRQTFLTEQAEIDGVVDACWDVLMLLCSKEGTVRIRYGEEGTNWTWNNDPEVKSYLGFEAWVNVIEDPFGVSNNVIWGQPMPCVLPMPEGEYAGTVGMSEWLEKRSALNAAAYHSSVEKMKENKYVLPDLVMTRQEDDDTKAERQNTQNAFKKWGNDFVKGLKDPANDAHWNQYLQDLDDKGLQTWLAQYQKIYEERFREATLADGANK